MQEDRDLASMLEARRLVRRAAAAQEQLEQFSQEQVDRVVGAIAAAAREHSKRLAQLAHEETGFGNPRDKHLKNEVAFKYVYEYIRDMLTVGVISRDKEKGIIEIAAPMGVVAAIVPSTNPTSTTIYKTLISIKARNTIVISPHPAAKGCVQETVKVMDEAGKKAGLPADSILCMQEVTLEGTKELMGFKKTGVVLATGNSALVKAAYSSGNPAYGVGPGNVPAYVHSSADIPKAAKDILVSKCFDYGTICSSEQSAVVDAVVAPQLKAEMQKLGAYFLSREEAGKVADALVMPTFLANPKLVGKPATYIAGQSGVSVPDGTHCLVAELSEVGKSEPLSIEKLSPVLAFYEVADWHEGCERCKQLLKFGGMGHTMSVHARDEEVIMAFALQKPASRICINTPSVHGSVGYSTNLPPSLTLGCGAAGNNITSDNITPMHLIDIKRAAYGTREVYPAWISPGSKATAASAEAPSQSRESIEQRVDEFFATKATGAAGISGEKKADESPADRTPPLEQEKPKPLPQPRLIAREPAQAVDFVSEFDVRQALNRGESIIVDSSTIITPLAAELGERDGVFVRQGSHFPRQ